jgi:hypothetical protein
MATRESSIDLYYDPEDLDPHAPRLRIAKKRGVWELRDEQGALLSHHPWLPEAIDAALERSAECCSEILVMAATGRFEWSVKHNPEFLELARAVKREAAAEREAAD